ncbi:MAG: hypothetical protein R3F56_16055 [Planctomycetota bacterium]
MTKVPSAIALAIVAAAAFFAGVTVAGRDTLAAQDRGPQRPRPQPSPPPGAAPAAPAPLVWGGDGGSAGSANGMIAVTGSYGVGTSVLYVLDTVHKQLAVYEARGGSPDSAKVFLVGARRIDLDLQLEGYNDLSEFNFDQLKRKFEGRERPTRDDPAERPIHSDRR